MITLACGHTAKNNTFCETIRIKAKHWGKKYVDEIEVCHDCAKEYKAKGLVITTAKDEYEYLR